MTGENNFKRAVRYGEVTFNGSKGEFFYRSRDAEKDENGKYPKEPLGKGISVVFLKVRRVLYAKYKPNAPTLRTSEHNVKGDIVTLFEGSNRVGSAVADSELSNVGSVWYGKVYHADS